MQLRHARWLVPVVAAGATAAFVVGPKAASGAEHPNLPAITAAQLLADLQGVKVPDFTGTVVSTSNLGLPSLPTGSLGGSTGSGLAQLEAMLTGSHTLKIAYGGPEKQRVAVLMSNLSETDLVHNGTDLWTYSSDSNSVTHSTLPADEAKKDATRGVTGMATTPEAAAESALSAVSPSTSVTVDRTASVAGRSAYQLVIAPKDPNSTIGSIRVAMDSATHLPLRVQVFPRSDTATPAFEIGFTDLTFHTPSASTFAFSTPPGATTKSGSEALLGSDFGAHEKRATAGAAPASEPEPTVLGKDWTSVISMSLPAGTDLSAGGLDKILTSTPKGQVLNTALVSVLITPDDKLLVGAVTPAYLESLAK